MFVLNPLHWRMFSSPTRWGCLSKLWVNTLHNTWTCVAVASSLQRYTSSVDPWERLWLCVFNISMSNISLYATELQTELQRLPLHSVRMTSSTSDDFNQFLRLHTLCSALLFPWLWDLYLAGLWLYSQDDPVAFGGVFTIQGEEEFSSASCGRVLISLTPRLIHSVSISFYDSYISAPSLLDLFQLSLMLLVQPEQHKAFQLKRKKGGQKMLQIIVFDWAIC